VLRVYRYRLWPTRAQEHSLFGLLNVCRELYNAALQERRDAWQKQHVSVSKKTQAHELKEVRAVREDVALVHNHLLQDALTRLDRAFRAFFRRCKAGEKPGYPRFKGRGQYHTLTFKDAPHKNGIALCSGGKRLRIYGVGNVKVKLHRPLEGTLRQAAVTLGTDDHWYVQFTCAVEPKPLPPTSKEVGLDVGIKTFAMLSDGTPIENPKWQAASRLRLERAARRVDRRRRGGSGRRAAARLLRHVHAKVVRQRLDFHHKTAKWLVENYDTIAVEDLNVKGLAKGMLAKQVHDAAWGQFLWVLGGKAESAGRSNPEVDCRGTTIDCSGCGEPVPKELSERIHRCPKCGLVLDRDVNGARNILKRAGLVRRGEAP
jgi:putative transposase